MSLPLKIITLLLLWGTIGYSAIGLVHSVYVRAILLVIAAGVTLHILILRTVTPDMLTEKTDGDA